MKDAVKKFNAMVRARGLSLHIDPRAAEDFAEIQAIEAPKESRARRHHHESDKLAYAMHGYLKGKK
jgi:hypothetical protein